MRENWERIRIKTTTNINKAHINKNTLKKKASLLKTSVLVLNCLIIADRLM